MPAHAEYSLGLASFGVQLRGMISELQYATMQGLKAKRLRV